MPRPSARLGVLSAVAVALLALRPPSEPARRALPPEALPGGCPDEAPAVSRRPRLCPAHLRRDTACGDGGPPERLRHVAEVRSVTGVGIPECFPVCVPTSAIPAAVGSVDDLQLGCCVLPGGARHGYAACDRHPLPPGWSSPFRWLRNGDDGGPVRVHAVRGLLSRAQRDPTRPGGLVSSVDVSGHLALPRSDTNDTSWQLQRLPVGVTVGGGAVRAVPGDASGGRLLTTEPWVRRWLTDRPEDLRQALRDALAALGDAAVTRAAAAALGAV